MFHIFYDGHFKHRVDERHATTLESRTGEGRSRATLNSLQMISSMTFTIIYACFITNLESIILLIDPSRSISVLCISLVRRIKH